MLPLRPSAGAVCVHLYLIQCNLVLGFNIIWYWKEKESVTGLQQYLALNFVLNLAISNGLTPRASFPYSLQWHEVLARSDTTVSPFKNRSQRLLL